MKKIDKHWVLTIVTAFAALYGIYSAEVGSIFRGPDFTISVSDKCRILQAYGQLVVQPDIHIRNVGKKTGTITRLAAFIKKKDVIAKTFLGKSYIPSSSLNPNYFLALGSFTIAPGEVWSARVTFSEDMTEDEYDTITRFEFESAKYLENKYENDNKDKKNS